MEGISMDGKPRLGSVPLNIQKVMGNFEVNLKIKGQG